MVNTRSNKKSEPLQAIIKTNDSKQPGGRSVSKKRPHSPGPHERSTSRKPFVSSEESSSGSEDETDYEKIRDKNLHDNELFFASLGIQQAKEALHQAKSSPKTHTHTRRESKAKAVLPRRQSLRIQRLNPDGEALPPLPVPETPFPEHPRLSEGPLEMKKSLVYEDEEKDHEQLVQFMIASNKDDSKVSDNLQFNKMKARKIKVCKDRLFSVAVHPSSTKVIAVAGDKWGQMGFWDVESDYSHHPTVYHPHSRPINHICFPFHDPQKVYSCSYDSTLRCGNFETGMFDLIYSVPEENDDLFRNFDFLDPSTLLLSQFRGDVAVVDTRTKSCKGDQLFMVCDKYLRSVSVHPINKNFFVTAGTDLKVCVWDMRLMKRKGTKPLHILPHARAPNSAYFSPVTGSHILDIAGDDTINHNNQTGRWLTKFRAVWHPTQENVFFVGSMKRPRRIEAFSVDGRLLHEFEDEEVLTSVCSVVQYHPYLPVLVGGNSSGYVFVFM
ncbi:hypothetical protein C0Q70_05356 [Pomacea canaliculata]|uniref:WD repeat-containing protein 76 n=1 Tax=Pomacea canaliculata TaxID=400727 RepID=A0A2T7PKY6_POMCA|nr:hypothetical protein C0Q70_05356 [Pomacea canaliculata]